jgi:hypothetical protein
MITIRQALCGLFLVAGAATLSGQNVPVAPSTAAGSVASRNASADSATANRKELTYYTQGISGGMFGAPVPAPMPEVKAPTPRKPKPQRIATTPAPAPDPLADYAFTGVVTMQGRPTALIEHKLTKSGTYIQIGDRFLNGKVTEIDGRQITLALNGKRRALARFENYRFTPLDTSAAYLASGARAPSGAPAAMVPGQTPQVPGQMGQPGMPPPGGGNALPPFPIQQVQGEQQAIIQKAMVEQQANVPQSQEKSEQVIEKVQPNPPPALPEG